MNTIRINPIFGSDVSDSPPGALELNGEIQLSDPPRGLHTRRRTVIVGRRSRDR